MSFWVYILKCADDSYYTGHTDNLETRVGAHESGEIPGYTHFRRPLTLAFTQEFPTREEALAAERQIKGWSRAKKEAMMRGDWSQVSVLAHKRTVRPLRRSSGQASTGLARTGNGFSGIGIS